MARPLRTIEIKENLSELKQLHKKVVPHLKMSIQMLILSKQGKASGKYALADAMGANRNSIKNWRSRYHQGGLKRLLEDKRGGNRAAVINSKTDRAILSKLSDPKNPSGSFKELLQWVNDNYIKGINYHTLN